MHLAVDTLGHLLALRVTAANEGDRTQVAALAQAIQEATGQSVEVAYVDQGYTGAETAQEAQEHGIRLEVVKLQEAKRGFVLLPKRWQAVGGRTLFCMGDALPPLGQRLRAFARNRGRVALFSLCLLDARLMLAQISPFLTDIS